MWRLPLEVACGLQTCLAEWSHKSLEQDIFPKWNISGSNKDVDRNYHKKLSFASLSSSLFSFLFPSSCSPLPSPTPLFVRGIHLSNVFYFFFYLLVSWLNVPLVISNFFSNIFKFSLWISDTCIQCILFISIHYCLPPILPSAPQLIFLPTSCPLLLNNWAWGLLPLS